MRKTKDQINLLPVEGKKAGAQRSGWLISLIVVFLLAWAGVHGWELKRSWTLQKHLALVEVRKQALVGEFRAIHRELGLSIPEHIGEERASIIQTLLGERVLWSEVFKHFSRIVPRGLWFDNLEGTSGERAEIKIKGGAMTYLPVAEFMLSIEKSGYFERPQLIYAQKAIVQGQDIIGFEIICGIRKGGTTP